MSSAAPPCTGKLRLVEVALLLAVPSGFIWEGFVHGTAVSSANKIGLSGTLCALGCILALKATTPKAPRRVNKPKQEGKLGVESSSITTRQHWRAPAVLSALLCLGRGERVFFYSACSACRPARFFIVCFGPFKDLVSGL